MYLWANRSKMNIEFRNWLQFFLSGRRTQSHLVWARPLPSLPTKTFIRHNKLSQEGSGDSDVPWENQTRVHNTYVLKFEKEAIWSATALGQPLPGSRTQLSPSDSTHNISGSLKQGRVANILAKVSFHCMETGNQKKRF